MRRSLLSLLSVFLIGLGTLLSPGAASADAPAPGVPVCSPIPNLLNGLGSGSGSLGLGGGGGGGDGTIAFSQSAYTANENAGQIWLTITRTSTAALEQIRYGVRQDSAQSPWDFQAVPNTLATMVPGQASCQFPVTIADNGMNGPPVQADAYLFGSSVAQLTPDPSNVVITILRNDPLQVRNPANPLELNPAPTNGDPLTGAQFYVEPPAQTAAGLAANLDLTQGAVADATALNFIAQQPTGYRFWFWKTPADPAPEVARFLENAQYGEPGRVVELSTYSIVHDHCGATANPAFTSRYLNWVRGLAQGIGNFRVVMFFEIDSIITTACLSPTQLHERLVDQLKPAIAILEQDPHLVLYLDGGASDALSARVDAARLREAGVADAQGFFVNSTHFQWDTTEIAYGQTVSRMLGGEHFLVSSGVNGRGPLLNPHPTYQGVEDLCNPPGRGLGTMSTQTGYTGLDGLLWFAPVGNSGGACRPGAPPTATFWPAYAIGLYENRRFGVTGPPRRLSRDGTFVPYSAAFATP
ncbi:glycoside hydrolase family 6 protein [Conexibacter sp. DBS9H8]|uniref:glycoside hydrolase family 6 protein n=1 Tax=Conexibacter sp. DBS9H8 TaxID=2937801 RepID=UPI00200F367F|nr:glycoside hydrolase family 6 protein [Conexibacter sp. DBS9H8]